jgi:hypothetical protein
VVSRQTPYFGRWQAFRPSWRPSPDPLARLAWEVQRTQPRLTIAPVVHAAENHVGKLERGGLLEAVTAPVQVNEAKGAPKVAIQAADGLWPVLRLGLILNRSQSTVVFWTWLMTLSPL